ncbi:MAG: hypothetical protein KDB22_07010 [Planctomycetales bacterium]|nr:hypothetical protein [Planctomycetales bacterium]
MSESFPQLDLHLCLADATLGQGQLMTGGQALQIVHVDSAQIGLMNTTFEAMGQRLAGNARCFFELDGSFVWTGETADNTWQIDGMLYDHSSRLQRLELRGCCPLHIWYQLISYTDSPIERLVCYLQSCRQFVPAGSLSLLWKASDERL